MSALSAAIPLETCTAGVSTASRVVWHEWRKARRHAAEPVTQRSLEQRFAELAATWREQRAHTSSVSEMVLNNAYQQIVALGRPVVRYILADLRSRPDHWFSALSAIEGINPIPTEAAGDLRAMSAAWLRWGEQEGLLD
jgi:hypothetical protein